VRIAVVGAGIVGVSTAEWLRRDGHEVTLIDRIEPGDPGQASYGNAGILAACGIVQVAVPGLPAKAPKMLLDPLGPLHLRWRYLPRLMPWLVPFLRRATMPEVERTARALAALLGDSVEQHRALARGTAAERYIREGVYAHLYRSRADYEADGAFHAIRRAHGFRMEERDRARLLEDDPRLGEHYGFAACWLDHGWITDPGAYVAALAGHFRRHGGTFLRAEAADLRPAGDGVELTVAGEARRYDRAVLSAGAWSAALARRLGHEPALESERGYHLVLRGPNRRPPFPYSLADGKFVVTPMDAGIRAAGQVELGGLHPRLSEKPFRVFAARLRQLYPDLEWEGEERWLGHRPSTVDSLPFIGPSPSAPQVHFAFGAQHVGLTSGPRTGRLIADLVAGRTPNIDIAPFRVGRFDRSAA
jgi:D-amino-acid dehydrogenase